MAGSSRADMRIAVVSSPFVAVPPTGYGGTELIVDMLARGYAAAGHDVLLYCTGDSTCPVPKAWTYDQAQQDRMGSTVVELRQAIEAYDAVNGFDIVDDHTLPAPLIAATMPDCPVVMTNRG